MKFKKINKIKVIKKTEYFHLKDVYIFSKVRRPFVEDFASKFRFSSSLSFNRGGILEAQSISKSFIYFSEKYNHSQYRSFFENMMGLISC